MISAGRTLNSSPVPDIGKDVQRFIDASGWMRELSPFERDEMMASVRVMIATKGTAIVRTGFAAEHWFGIVEGLAAQSVTLSNGQVMHLSAGSTGTWFGEGTLIKGGMWEYDAIALRRTRVILIPASRFNWLRQRSIAFNWHLQALLNNRLSSFMALAVTLRTGSALERVTGALWQLCVGMDPSARVMVRISQSELGLFAALSRQHTNVALQKLRERKLIEVHRAGIEILDLISLRESLLR